MSSPVIDGHVSPEYESVARSFARLWEEIEVGASVAVYHNSELVVDLHGGFTDRDCSIPWRADTLVNTYSTSKGITAIALACLAADGLLDYQAPVVDYWPEFGAENKFDITVSQALSHQTGLYTFNPPITIEALYDWQIATFNIASQVPAWPPGGGFGCHSITWGYIAGEIVRRITGVSLGCFLRERITEPLGADVHLGLSESDMERCADLIGPNHARKLRKKDVKKPESDATTDKLISQDPALTPYRDICSPAWRQAEVPASNVHATAKGLARCYEAFINGELVSESTLQCSIREQTRGETDLCFGRPVRRSRGFILNCNDCYCGPEASAFGHSGTGGSIAFADPVNKITFAYVMNQLDSESGVRSKQLVNSLYSCL